MTIIVVMKHSQTYTTVEYKFYISIPKESFREIKMSWLQFPRLETHRTPRIYICVVCYALDQIIHRIVYCLDFNTRIHTRPVCPLLPLTSGQGP